MRDDLEFNVEFCEEVGNHPCLYDFNRVDYCNRGSQDKAWQKISKKFEVQVADCKDRWKNIRGRYTKYLNLMKLPAEPGSKRPKQYYLASHLQFLDPFLKSRPRKDIFGQPIQEESSEEEQGDVGHWLSWAIKEEPDDTSTNQLASNSPPPTSELNKNSGNRKRKLSASLQDGNSSTYAYLDAKQQENHTSLECLDPDMAFLRSILPDMKAMNDRQKRSFKIGILRLAEETLYPANNQSGNKEPNH